MTPTTLAETILRDVKRYEPDWAKEPYDRSEMVESTVGDWLSRDEVLAALTAALDPAIAEKAGEEIESLRLWNRDDAADLITAILAQNAALRKERDASNELGRAFEEDAGQQRERAEAAEAQNAALTAQVEGLTGAVKGLVEILDQHETKGPLPDVALMFCWLAAQEVRAVMRKDGGQ